MKFELENVCAAKDGFRLELNESVEAEVLGIFGPSGAGKTTLLNVIAGLRPIGRGRIAVGGELFNDAAAGQMLPARKRGLGYVPQDLALFPHLSVRKNVLYGSRESGRSSPLRRIRFDAVIQVLEIGRLLERSTLNLSGGEKRRVALARALMTEPRLLLLDEPLAHLDFELKGRIIDCLKRVRAEFGTPMIFVSHDPDEMLALCDFVWALREGRVARRDTAARFFTAP